MDRLAPWPRRVPGQNLPPPPEVTPQLVRQVQEQDVNALPEQPYPPALAGFVRQLHAWREKLAQHFGFSARCYADNTRAAAPRILRRISFLPRERVERVIRIVCEGYRIPFASPPPPYHRFANSPDLKLHAKQAWAALLKDISHGAVAPCDLPRDGKPTIVSPVRTAPKGWRSGQRRFVVNMRYINKFVPPAESSCSLETLSVIRNLLGFPASESPVAWFVTMDLASGYHNFWIHKSQWHLMGFAIHESELPPAAVHHLKSKYPGSYDFTGSTFYFIMRALPFGLGPSCAVFSLVITTLAASWRRHSICGNALRLTSYIDDFLSASRSVRA